MQPIFVPCRLKPIAVTMPEQAGSWIKNIVKNSAVMLLALVFMLAVLDVANAAAYERTARYVNDYASLLTQQKAGALTASLKAFEDKELIEVSVLTVEKFPENEEGIDALLDDTYRDWNMGKTETESSSYKQRVQAFAKEQNLAEQVRTKSLEEVIKKYAGVMPKERPGGRAVLVIFSKEDKAVRVINGNGFGLAKGEWRELGIYQFSPILTHNDMAKAIELIVDIVQRRSLNMLETADNFSADYPGFRAPLHRFSLKRYDRYVNDFAGLLSPAVTASLTRGLQDYEQESGTEISVLTVHSYQAVSSQKSWEGFATEVFRDFDIGGKNISQSENRGVLFIVSDEDRKVRIEMGAGYSGLYDTVMKQVVDNVTPILSDANYIGGITYGVAQIIDATRANVTYWQWYKWPIFAGSVVFLSLVVAIRNRLQEYVAIHWLIAGCIGSVVIVVCQVLFKVLKAIPHGNRNRNYHYHGGIDGGFNGGSGSGGSSSGGASGNF